MNGLQSAIELNSHDITKLLKMLKSNETRALLNDTPVSVITETIGNLYITHQPLGILFLLNSQIKSIPETQEQSSIPDTTSAQALAFWRQTTTFLQGFPKHQVTLAYKQLGNLCRAYVHVSIALRQTKASIRPLQKALLTLDLPSYQLTPLHACLTLMCVHSQCYFAAMPLVEETMLEMNPEVHFVIVADILKYFYYGGMAFLGMKKYQQALEFFKMAITLPAKQLSLIMVEAYKKYILVSAILFYQPSLELPAATSRLVQRNIKEYCASYIALVTLQSESEPFTAMRLYLETNPTAFQESGNYGLAKQAVIAVQRHKIQCATHVFSTLSLQDLAKYAGYVDAATTMKDIHLLIREKKINATIDMQNQMITFDEHATSGVHPSASMFTRLQSELSQVLQFSEHLRRIDLEEMLDPQYQKMINSARNMWKSPTSQWMDTSEDII